MTQTFRPYLLDDRPAEQDYLDFDAYTHALEELIMHPKTSTPFTLGIFGRWGTGKTTLLRMLEHRLKQKGMITVQFNAWQYNNENELWAAFLQSVLNIIEDKLPAAERIDYKIRLLWSRVDQDGIVEELLNYSIRAFGIIIIFLLTQAFSRLEQEAMSSRAIETIGGIVSIILGIWFIVKPALEQVQSNVSIDFNAFWKQSDYKKHIAFLDKFREHFEDAIRSLPPVSGNPNKRVAIFIDDLDRCAPDRVLQVLDAIKLFVNIPGCVYILGLDADIAQKAVSIKYEDDMVAQREYLGKIIQLPFQLPPLTAREMGRFLERLDVALPDKRCHEVFIAGLVMNPREVKRTINSFSLLWSLAKKRPELEGKIIPVRLAKVVVIQHGYPELHKILQKKPHLLAVLERFFHQDLTREEMSIGISNAQLKQLVSNRGNLQKLQDILAKQFSEENIKTICLDLGIDYENLVGLGKTGKVIALIQYGERQGRLIDLFKFSKQRSPDLFSWSEFIIVDDTDDLFGLTVETEPIADTTTEQEMRSKLQEILGRRFSTDDIRSICYKLDIEYENLPGGSKADKVRELIDLAGRQGRLTELLSVVSRYNVTPSTRMVELPLELRSFASNEALHQMFVLHKAESVTEANFSSLAPDEVAVYFTLTSQVESPVMTGNGSAYTVNGGAKIADGGH